jgi:hypothetical protein
MVTAHILLPALLLATNLNAAPRTLWVSEKVEPSLWRYMRLAFHAELLPDDPAATAPVVAQRYKYIARLARAEDTCLVIIGQRETRNDPPGDDYFLAISYDLKSHRKTPITPGGFRRWRFVAWAFLVPGIYPEVIFRHQSCSECEATYLLSSFFLDPASHAWTIRRWPKDEDSILIGSDRQLDDDNWWITCMFRVADFTGDGNADIGLWCRRIFEARRRKTEETLTLYTVPAGEPTMLTPDASQTRSLKRALCAGQPSHAFCRNRP